MAQTQIGGGTCNSSSLNGTYAVTLAGRQVTSAGNFSNIFQANGSATFDGQSKVAFALTSNTLQSLGTQISYAGTYSVQANCAGLVNIATGGSITFNLAIYNQGKNFLVAGSDATYSYTGSGGTQPTGCATSMLSGVYTFNATGYSFASSVKGITNAEGLLQFDGQGNVIANLSSAAGGAAIASTTASGTYSLSANCLGTATLTDAGGNSMSMIFSITAAKATSFDVLVAEASKYMITGSGRAVYGQPTAAAFELLRREAIPSYRRRA